jgi:protein-tyrosine phosphatase
VGGLSDAEELAEGNPGGITTVISLSEIAVRTRRRGINYLHLPIEDDRPVPAGDFDAVIDSIAENVRWGTVLVNCGVGISRAPTMTAAYMHCVGYRNIDAAIAEIKRLRQDIDPSDILLNSVRRHL